MKRQYKKIGIILSLCLAAALTGCGAKDKEEDMRPLEITAIQTTPVATIKIRDYGTITAQLEPEMAPNTVNNFITLANKGFYDGLTFHRVIEGFMIQGGDPEGTGAGGPDYNIPGEFAENGYAQNTLSHEKGVLSMARTSAPDSAGSQFFIMAEDGTYLDGQYAAFGKVTDGMEVVSAIEQVKTDENDKPLNDVVIESIRVDTNNAEVPRVIKTSDLQKEADGHIQADTKISN